MSFIQYILPVILVTTHPYLVSATSAEDFSALGRRWDPASLPDSQICTQFEKKAPLYNTDGEVIGTTWAMTSTDVSRNQCSQVCGQEVAEQIASGNVSSIQSVACISTAEDRDWEFFSSDVRAAPANCTCNFPLINELAEDIVEALPAIGAIACEAFTTSIDLVLEVGLMAIPGAGEAISAGMIALKAAARLATYTMKTADEAADAFSSYVTMGFGVSGGFSELCPKQYLPSDLRDVFDTINSVAVGGFKPKWPKGSGKPGDFPLPRGWKPESGPKKTKPTDKQTKPTEDPKTTAKSPETTEKTTPTTEKTQKTTTTKPKQCTKRNNKRGPKPPANDDDCDDGTTHAWVVDKSEAARELKTVTVTCPSDKDPQACIHYYSAIQRGAKKRFTCSDDNKRQDGFAVGSWTRQHNAGLGWRDFTQPSYPDADSKDGPHCQADEWPPGYFLPMGDARCDPEWGQLIRWLPRLENIQAGKIWEGFCADYDGGYKNGQRAEKVQDGGDENHIPLNKQLVDPGQKSNVVKDVRGDKTTLSTHYHTVTYTRAVFEIDFDFQDTETPSEDNEWYLKENPCWPKYIVPDDPGWVLLKQDNWYKTYKYFPKGFDTAAEFESYRQYPDDTRRQQAIERQKEAEGKRVGGPGDQGPEKPASKQPKQDPPTKRLEMIDGGLAIRDDLFNVSRRLTEEELKQDLDVIHCADRHCSAERQQVSDGDGYLFIPGNGPPSTPSVNTAVPTFVTCVSMVDVNMKRRSLSGDIPAVTATS